MTWSTRQETRRAIVTAMQCAGKRLTPQQIAPLVGKAAPTVLSMLNAMLDDDVVDRKNINDGPLRRHIQCTWGLTGKPLPDVPTAVTAGGATRAYEHRALAQALGMSLTPPPAVGARIKVLEGRRL